VVASADLWPGHPARSRCSARGPSKLLGYRRQAKPIVASFPEGGDAPRVIREAGCGICVPPGDPRGSRKRIVEAAANPTSVGPGRAGRGSSSNAHDRSGVVALYVNRSSSSSPTVALLSSKPARGLASKATADLFQRRRPAALTLAAAESYYSRSTRRSRSA